MCEESYKILKEYACGICGNVPDENGVLEHAKGCYTENSDGGGYSFLEFTEKDTLKLKEIKMSEAKYINGEKCEAVIKQIYNIFKSNEITANEGACIAGMILNNSSSRIAVESLKKSIRIS